MIISQESYYMKTVHVMVKNIQQNCGRACTYLGQNRNDDGNDDDVIVIDKNVKNLTIELQKSSYLGQLPPGHSSAASQVALKINKEAAGRPPKGK